MSTKTASRSFWIQVVGSKKTGKTSLLESLTSEFVRRGRSVCFVKHAHEPPILDGADTDTARLRRAGAGTTVLVGETSTVVFRTNESEPLDGIAMRESGAEDIVLAEGFKTTPGKKIAVAGGDLDVAALDGLIAVIGDAPVGYDGKTFRADETAEICDAIEAALEEERGRWVTSLTIDGHEVPLNAFVQEFVASGILGMVTALDDVEGGSVLEVRCRRIGTARPTEG